MADQGNQQQRINPDLSLNMYGFPVSMRIYYLPNRAEHWAQRGQWNIPVTVPLAFLIQVSESNPLGTTVKVERNVGNIRVKLILPIAYKEERKLPYCFGMLVCPIPQQCLDLIQMCVLLVPMVPGNSQLLRQLHNLFSEYASRLTTTRDQMPARGGSSVGGSGTRRRGQWAESGTEADAKRRRLAWTPANGDGHKVETIDLTEEEQKVAEGTGPVNSPPGSNGTKSTYSLQMPARGGSSVRGSGTRRRGQRAESGTEADAKRRRLAWTPANGDGHKVETIDLVEEEHIETVKSF